MKIILYNSSAEKNRVNKYHTHKFLLLKREAITAINNVPDEIRKYYTWRAK